MKITLTCEEARKVLCEAVKQKYEQAFREAHGFVTYGDDRCTFDLITDGEVVESGTLSSIGIVHFEAINIKKVIEDGE